MAKICSADRDRTTLGRRIDVLELAGTQNLDRGGIRMNALLPHDNSRYFGLLSSIEPHEDHQIATITVINNYRVILPLDLDLSEYLNGPVGIACIAGKFYVRELEA